MPNVDGEAISQMTELADPGSGDFFPLIRSGVTYKADVGNVSGGGGAPTRVQVLDVLGVEANGGTFDYSGTGAIAAGYTKIGVGSTAVAKVSATAAGAVALGAAIAIHDGRHAYVRAGDVGAFALGYAYSKGTVGDAIIEAPASSGAAAGSLAGGYAYANAVGDAKIQSHGRGGITWGYAYNGGYLRGTGEGSVTMGYAGAGGYLRAQGTGSFVFGHAYGAGAVVNARGTGSFASGRATAGQTISAYAVNCQQFGPGTNNEANTLAVGTTVRLKGTTGAPGTPRNGDVWVNSNYVYIRSNGVSVKVT